MRWLRMYHFVLTYSNWESVTVCASESFEALSDGVQQSREEMEVLFTLLAERYERGSVMLTSNLPFSQWTAIFKDPMTTAAAIDRLVHQSVIVELNVPSYRLETAKGSKKPAVNDAESASKK
jgi:hypothetical protein